MIFARVAGTVVLTQRVDQVPGAKFLLVEACTPRQEGRGEYLVALDVVGAGVGAPPVWAGQAPDTYRLTGGAIDLIYIAGGGIQGHPDGPGAGVRSIRQAWDAAMSGITLEEYARDHGELAAALRRWG